eukprot:m.413424 g.413424  ORF g.413424 m.413424 type:complete len:106 (+) comp21265_c0_seq14:703-1020(+)
MCPATRCHSDRQSWGLGGGSAETWCCGRLDAAESEGLHGIDRDVRDGLVPARVEHNRVCGLVGGGAAVAPSVATTSAHAVTAPMQRTHLHHSEDGRRQQASHGVI